MNGDIDRVVFNLLLRLDALEEFHSLCLVQSRSFGLGEVGSLFGQFCCFCIDLDLDAIQFMFHCVTLAGRF